MKFNQLCMCALSFIFASSAYSQVAEHGECLLVDESNMDISVMAPDGQKLGYVSLEPDNSWYVFINGEGALNETVVDQSKAIEHVCSAAQNLSSTESTN
ncbi:hypothetical protein AB6E39_15760 [Vibrio splendidus]|uniref:hypothetical protein n=1 Tax=Vibrio splendidus TaxID=29497 RepID=UPI001E532677|nr:hypothetical protein [Vibrio splendidus]MCC4789344.1 hypothetical protein [Vibrio splendidus]